MFGIEPLTPAYGKDYESIAQARYDLFEGKDFKTANGQYCSIRDLRRLGMKTVQVRFHRGLMGYERTGVVNLEQRIGGDNDC